MATIPTNEEIQEWIFEAIRQKNVRAGEIAFDVTQMQIALDRRGVRSNEYTNALRGLLDDGLFTTGSGGKFFLLTEKGFGRL